MKPTKKRPNRNEQRAARQLAQDEGLSYMQALQRVRNDRDRARGETITAAPPADTNEQLPSTMRLVDNAE